MRRAIGFHAAESNIGLLAGVLRQIDGESCKILESKQSDGYFSLNIKKFMPLYEYQCKKCGHRFERIRKFSDPPIKKCPECGGAVEQLVSAPAVQFKGSGWYVTDYAKKSSMPGSSHDGGSEPKTESKAESKSESKKESAPKDSASRKPKAESKKD
jgi:putative FmdB family regulatory protein